MNDERKARRTKSPVAAQYRLAPPISNSTVPFLPFRRRPSSSSAAAAADGSADLAAAPHAPPDPTPSPPAANPGRVADRDGPNASPAV